MSTRTYTGGPGKMAQFQPFAEESPFQTNTVQVDNNTNSHGERSWPFLASPEPGVFDEAAKGPWGAMTVLCGGVHWSPMAYLGSLIVVLALQLGPFVQQVLGSIPMREVVVDDDAVSFGYTHNYAFGASFGARGDPSMENRRVEGTGTIIHRLRVSRHIPTLKVPRDYTYLLRSSLQVILANPIRSSR